MTGMYETVTERAGRRISAAPSASRWKAAAHHGRQAPLQKYDLRVAGSLRAEGKAFPVALGGSDAATAQVGARNAKSGSFKHLGSSEMVSSSQQTRRRSA